MDMGYRCCIAASYRTHLTLNRFVYCVLSVPVLQALKQ